MKWNKSIKNQTSHKIWSTTASTTHRQLNPNGLTSNRVHSSPIQIIRLRPLHDPVDLLAGIADCQKRPIQIADGTSLPALHFEESLEGSQVFLFHFGRCRRRRWRCGRGRGRGRCCDGRRGKGSKAIGSVVVIEERGAGGGKTSTGRAIQRFDMLLRRKWWGVVKKRQDGRGRNEPLEGNCGSHGFCKRRQQVLILWSIIFCGQEEIDTDRRCGDGDNARVLRWYHTIRGTR